MKRITDLIVQFMKRHDGRWSLDDQTLTVQIGESTRHHDIRIERQGRDYALTAVVLSATDVTRTAKGRRQLARLTWLRNAEHDLVTFGFDQQDRLIGYIRHPAEHIDGDELDAYIHVLTCECDRFEYLLTGKDVY